MKNIFKVGPGFEVPDGTIVHSILDPRSASQEGHSWVDDVSLALGEIPAKTTSKIHIHPVVTQTTWVISGNLSVKMKDPSSNEPYVLTLTPEQTVLTQPGTFFQLINTSNTLARVLYIVTPAFIFEADASGVKYNDALVLDETWDDLRRTNWILPQLQQLEAVRSKREQSKKRLLFSPAPVLSEVEG